MFEIFRWSGEDRNTREDMKDCTYRRQNIDHLHSISGGKSVEYL